MLYHSRQIMDVESNDTTGQLLFDFAFEADFHPESDDVILFFDGLEISQDNGMTFEPLIPGFLTAVIGGDRYMDMYNAAYRWIADNNDFRQDYEDYQVDRAMDRNAE